MSLSTVYHTGPVTALHCHGNSVLAGIGSQLHAYCIQHTELHQTIEILPARVIHGIKQVFDNGQSTQLCVYGQKCLRLVEFDSVTMAIKTLGEVLEFPDWIWDVTWIQDSPMKRLLCLALGHNVIVTYDVDQQCIVSSVHCQEKCILYCAKFLTSMLDCVILAAGTVFNQVVIWSAQSALNTTGRVEPFHRLTGHQGVIFSVDYDPKSRLICSVSDDRSIRLYKILFNETTDKLSLSDWENMDTTLLHVLYGHSARVWDVRLLATSFVSIGEDSTCCIWSYEGRVIKKFKGHKGKSIWSMCVDKRENYVITGGRLEPTEPPTPEDERPSLHVQYAEDLQPVNPVQPSVKESRESRSNVLFGDKNSRSRETLDDKHRSKVSVSSVTLKPNVNGIRAAPMPLQDLSIEELDTDMDTFDRFRGTRYSFKKDEMKNPVTTDILLPRRKETQGDSVQVDDVRTIEKDSKPTVGREDTPYPSSEPSVPALKPKQLYEPLSEEKTNHQISLDSSETGLTDKPGKDNSKITKLELTNEREENIVTFDMSKDKRYIKKENDGSRVESDNVIGERSGTLSDIQVQTSQENYTEKHPRVGPKTMYEQDLNRTRKTRKRKHVRSRQSDYTQRSPTRTLDDKEDDRFFEGSLKSLKVRPGSVTSTWTMDSRKSLGSNDTLNSFDMDTHDEAKYDKYSYIKSGTTPISFRTLDEPTEIIDLEDNGDLNNDDSWLSEEPTKPEGQFDAWFGMKPYAATSSAGRRDAGVIKSNASGPSSSELNTKQKLMYSRYARRPKSESVLRNVGRPPLPPGAHLNMRPVSDTGRKHERFYTTDLDIH